MITVTRNCKLVPCSSIASGGTGNIGGYTVRKLADGKCWQTKNYKMVPWASRSCPTGFTMPTKGDFDTLISKYNGGSGPELYNALADGSGNTIWSSTSYDTNHAYTLNLRTSYSDVANDGIKTTSYYIRCYASS